MGGEGPSPQYMAQEPVMHGVDGRYRAAPRHPSGGLGSGGHGARRDVRAVDPQLTQEHDGDFTDASQMLRCETGPRS